MTRDDIIRMAREAGWDLEWGGTTIEQVQNFAALVAAAERESCAAFLESGVDLAGLAGDPMMQAFTGTLLIGCAKAIRARGDA